MKLQRREFLRLAAAAATMPATTRFASAQNYPIRPARIIEGFGGGSTPDLVARLVGASGQSGLSRSHLQRIRRLRQSPSGQDQYCLARGWHTNACRRGAVET